MRIPMRWIASTALVRFGTHRIRESYDTEDASTSRDIDIGRRAPPLAFNAAGTATSLSLISSRFPTSTTSLPIRAETPRPGL